MRRGRQAFVGSRSEAASVQVVPAGTQELRVHAGVEGARPQGWYAARHGWRRPAPVLSLIASGRLPYVFGYALVPRSTEPVDLAFEHDAFRLGVRLVTAGTEYAMTVVQGDVEIAVRSV